MSCKFTINNIGVIKTVEMKKIAILTVTTANATVVNVMRFIVIIALLPLLMKVMI